MAQRVERDEAERHAAVERGRRLAVKAQAQRRLGRLQLLRQLHQRSLGHHRGHGVGRGPQTGEDLGKQFVRPLGAPVLAGAAVLQA